MTDIYPSSINVAAFDYAKAMYESALKRLAAGDIRDAAEKAWCATLQATNAVIYERTGTMPEKTRRTPPGSWTDWRNERPNWKPWWGGTTRGRDNCTASVSTSACASPWKRRSGASPRRSRTSKTPSGLPVRDARSPSLTSMSRRLGGDRGGNIVDADAIADIYSAKPTTMFANADNCSRLDRAF